MAARKATEADMRKIVLCLTNGYREAFAANLADAVRKLANDGCALIHAAGGVTAGQQQDIVRDISKQVEDNLVKLALSIAQGPVIHGFSELDESVKLRVVGKVQTPDDVDFLVTGRRRIREVAAATYITGVNHALWQITNGTAIGAGDGSSAKQQAKQDAGEGGLSKAVSVAALQSCPVQPAFLEDGAPDLNRAIDAKETGEILMAIGAASGQPELVIGGIVFYAVGALLD